MTNITVPIGKGTTQVIGDRQKQQARRSIQPLGDLQFRQELADEGRLVLESGTANATTSAVVSITPPNGTTFFFLEAFFSATSFNGEMTLDLIKAGTIIDQIITEGNIPNNGSFHLPFDKLVGNDSDTMQIDFTLSGVGGNVTVIICGYFENTVSFRQ